MKKIKALLIVLALLGSRPAFCADAILLRTSGIVQVRVKGKNIFGEAKPGTQLNFGDTVQTEQAAKAQILFAGGNAILIKESTTVKLDGKAGKILLRVPKGEFLIGLKKRLARNESFRVKTPAAVAAVRGTLFWGQSDDKLNSTYACLQHAITISAQGKTMKLEAGEKTFIPYGQSPRKKEASKVPPEFLDSFEVDGSIEGLKELLGAK